MKKLFAVALIASTLAAAGCTTMGDQSLASTDRAAVNHYIVDGKTTMADVRAVFGETKTKNPTSDGGEFWYYSAVNLHMAAPIIKTLGVNFNGKGVVTSHAYGEKS